MDLDLEIAGRHRRASEAEAEVVGELSLADLDLLKPAKPRYELKKLSQRHHALARALASGLPQTDAAIVAGYTSMNVSLLVADPSFKELVRFYQQQVDEKYLGMHEQLAALGLEALNELRERLESEPDKLGSSLLLEIVGKMADRVGHGPSSTSTQVNVNINLASRLELARKRVEEARAASLTIEHQEAAE